MTEPGQPWVMISGKRVLVLGLDVDEVDVDAVDLGRELRERIELASALRQSWSVAQ